MVPLDLFRMSNLRSTETGVAGTVIWVSAAEPSSDELLGPRLWLVRGDDLSPERLDDAVVVPLTSPPGVWRKLPPKIARTLGSFIEANRVVLLAYWDAEISTKELLDRLVAP